MGIRRIKYQFPSNSDKYISHQAKDLISSIFTKEPSERPNLIQIRNAPFFTEMPIPKQLPHCILKRAPSNKELFGTEDVDSMYKKQQQIKQQQQQQKSSSRPPLVSKGFNQQNFNQYGSHSHSHSHSMQNQQNRNQNQYAMNS